MWILLYIHQPAGNWFAGYRMLEKAYREGKEQNPLVSRILKENIWKSWKQSGKLYLSLFRWKHIHFLKKKELRVTLDKYGIKLMSGIRWDMEIALMNELVFARTWQKIWKTPAQVILRWHTQMGFVVIPK